MMLNDSMYGILFRDINPIRTFVDQRFSRQVHARAGIIINTGEDNYLTTADAVEAAHTVTVSQLLNEYFAKEAGLEDWQLGLGHAFEINPDVPDSFRLELAHALLARELFPNAPLKWMPPTKHMTGDVFRGYLLDGFFNLVGALTGQGILLVGMMTEAVVTPLLSDRDLALQNVRYVLNAAGSLHEDFRPQPGGFIQNRAHQVLDEAIELLERITGEPGNGAAAGRDRRRHVRADEAAGGRGQGATTASSAGAAATTTRPPRSWRDAHEQRVGPGSERAVRSTAMPRTRASTDRPPVRRHHRRRHGAAVLHPAGRRTTSGPRAPRCSSRRRWAWTRRWSCTPSRWGRDFTFFVVYGAREPPGRPVRTVEVLEREYPLLTRQGGQRRRQARGCGASWSWSAPASAPTRTPSGIDAILNIKGFAGEKGLEYYRELKVVNLGAQVLGARARRAGPRGEGRRRARLPGRHPARRAPAQHPRDVGGVPRGLPGRPAPAAGRRRPAVRRDAWPPSSASTGSSAAAPRPARWPATSCTP